MSNQQNSSDEVPISEEQNFQKKQLMYMRALTILLWTVAGIALAYLIFKYILIWFIPFIIAWLIASLIEPFVGSVCNKTKIPREVVSGVSVVGSVGILLTLSYSLIAQLTHETVILLQNLPNLESKINGFIASITEWIGEILSVLPITDLMIDKSISSMLSSTLTGFLSALPAQILDILTFLATSVPTTIIMIIITIISAFFISSDFIRIRRFISAQMPKKVRPWLGEIQAFIFSSAGKLIRAYTLILFITFIELSVGLTILGVEYAITIALITAILDIMPILGSGAVLAPWAIYNIIMGNYYVGVGLLVVYAIVTIIRQYIEPKIVGKHIGLHPLVTLMCVYLGFKTLGVFGVLVFPFAMILLKYLHDSKKITIWRDVNTTK